MYLPEIKIIKSEGRAGRASPNPFNGVHRYEDEKRGL